MVVVISDTHFTKNNTSTVNNIFVQCLDYCEEIGCKTVIHCGDVFTERVGQGLNVLTAFLNVLDEFQNRGIKMIAISGNHDKTDLDGVESYLDVFAHHPSLQLVREYDSFKINGLNCHFLPYFKENGSYPERLKKVAENAKDGVNLLFTHIAVNGVSNNDVVGVTDGVKLNLFNKFDGVFVGHYHNRSKVGRKIFYIGSPRPKDFGENDEKGFTILKAKASGFEQEFKRAIFKPFVNHYFELKNYTITSIEDKVRSLAKRLDKEHIKLKFQGTEDELDTMVKNDWGQIGFHVEKISVGLLRNIELATKQNFTGFNNIEITDSFFDYMEENSIEDENRLFGEKLIKML